LVILHTVTVDVAVLLAGNGSKRLQTGGNPAPIP
jgi:hypothetical protein